LLVCSLFLFNLKMCEFVLCVLIHLKYTPLKVIILINSEGQ
jgi:hypothetical protein